MRNERGFTLVELLIAIVIGMFLLIAIVAAMNTGQRSSVAVDRKVAAGQDARAALEIMAMEIRMASYNPNFAGGGMWRDTAACGNPAAVQTSKGIQGATATAMTVEMDIGNSSVVGDDPNEIIGYALVCDAGGQGCWLTRSTNCGGPQPFLGDDPASGRPRTVRVVNNDLGIPIFRYFDGRGVEIAPATLLASTAGVRRVEIILAVETDAVDQNTNQRRRLIYSTSVIPRNHAINTQPI